MRNGKITQLRTVWRDEEKNIQGGIDFYLLEGSRIVMYQSWEHWASGPVWDQIAPDVIGESGLLEYWLSCWKHSEDGKVYEVQDVDNDFR